MTAVIVTYNSRAVIVGCLEALGRQAPEVPVVVVDNDSHDGTPDLVARRFRHVLLERAGRNGGYAAGINLGAMVAAPGDDLLVLNPDTRIRAGCVDALVSALGATSCGVAVPRLVGPDGCTAHSLRRRPTLLRAVGEAVLGGERAGRFAALGEIVVDAGRYATPGVVDWASGAAMLVDRRCHADLDGWDETFFLYAEETDFCLRAGDHGWQVRFTPEAVVEHIGGHGERTALRETLVANKAVLYRRRHGTVAGLAYRGVLAVNEALRWRRGPHHRASLARLVRGRGQVELR